MIYTKIVDKKKSDYKNMRSGKYITQLKDKDLQYKAFVPELLPFKIDFNGELQQLLSKADLALGRLDGIAENLPDVDFFIKMYVRKEATFSSQVEGTQATFADLLNAEAKIEGLEKHEDVDEILNYIQAMNYGLERLKTLPISLRLIKELHKILLQGVRGENKDPGEFRRSQNWVGGSSIKKASFVPCPPQEVISKLDNLEGFMYKNSQIPVLIKTGLIHAQFENIHPFLDGNGRMGRLLITFYLCQQEVLKKPLLYLSAFFKKNRQEYYNRLNAIHEQDDIEGWLKFFLDGIIETSSQAVETNKKIIELRKQDLEKILTLGSSSKKATQIFNYLAHTPFLTIKDAEKITGLKNPNASVLIKKIVGLGILEEKTKKKRNQVFRYQKYVNIFEQEND